MKRKLNSEGRDRSVRKRSIRKLLSGTQDRPRLCVFRSLRYTYAQIIADDVGAVLAATSTQSFTAPDCSSQCKDSAKELGRRIASLAIEKGISKVVFDRNGYRYHGRVSAVAEGAREGGLEF